jgi:hypothetical protein
MVTTLHNKSRRQVSWLSGIFAMMLLTFSGGVFAQNISTFAGTGSGGNSGNGGLATAAAISCGYGICEDSFGNVFFTTGTGLRKIDPSGIITDFVPSGFSYSLGVVSDASGDLYVADYSNNIVYKVTSLGVVSVFAGTGSYGYNGDNIAATSATLASPTAIAIDATGNIYISDGGNNRIRKIDLAGIITTVGGTGFGGYSGNGGPATAANMSYPFGLDVDAAGNIYISELGNYVIRKIDAAGIITLVGGSPFNPGFSGDGGPATSALFIPVGLALDNAGNIYIADEGNYRVRKIDLSGIVTTVAGTGTFGYSGDGGPATSAQLANVNGLTITSSGTMILVDAGNNRLRSVGGFGMSLTVSGTSNDETPCNNSNNGTATVTTVTGGTAPYTYSWAPSGGTNATATGLSAGTYTVTVTDATLNTGTQTFTITEPTAITASTASQTNISCNGGSNGSATIVASGGGSPFYSYSWSPSGGTGTTASGLSAGNYTVTISNVFGCTGTQSFNITQPAALVITPSQTNINCFGNNNGSATATVTGGTGSYTYSWAPSGGTGATASSLAPGNYTVTVTDANSCTATQAYTISQPSAALAATAGTVNNVSCFGGSNGSATVNVTGGTPAYSYSWAPSGGTGATASGLTAGNYTVTVTDANSCTTTQTFAITEPSAALAATTSQTNVSCFGGANGTASVSVTGGTTAYSYSWAPSGGTAATASGLTAGNYTVTITDANSCQLTQAFAITEPAAALAATASQTDVSCNGGSNGTATVAVTGGTTAYTYSWSPSGGTGATASGLAAGNYTVTVTDANSCQITQAYTITEPTLITSTATQTNLTCNGGSDGTAGVTVSGGTPGYTYSWSPSGGTAATATNLTAGNYTVTVMDANLCVHTRTFNVTEPTAITAVASQTNVSCFGGSNGTATVVASGGSSPFYAYSWSPSGGTGTTASGLTAGNYTVTISNGLGCTGTQTFTITEPTQLVATAAAQTNLACNGGTTGSATVSVTGGTPGYTYAWSPTGGTSATASGLAAGTYTVAATDVNGCITTQTFTLTQPTAIATTGSNTNVSCFGGANGTATVSATGGTGAYTYSWAPSGGTANTATGLVAGTYTVTVTDANACTATHTYTITQPALLTSTGSSTNVSCFGGSNGTATVVATGGTTAYTYSWAPSGGTAATATGLAAGNYTVTVTDANACTTTNSFTISEPSAITTVGTQTNVSCNGGTNGSATVTATGGTGAYTYNWLPTGGTAATASGLASAVYTVTVTDANGCIATRTFNITEPAVLATTGSQVNVSCNGNNDATATVTATGGTAPYAYLWTPTGGTAATASNLTPGIYSVTVTDINGCTATQAYTITEPVILTATGSNTNVLCFGAATATATVVPAGGTTPYTYSWAPTGGTAATATGLAAGTYTVTVTDANLCMTTMSYTITEPTQLTTTGSQTNVLCNSGSTGTATVVATGGTGAYTYNWTPMGGTAATATGLPSDVYTVTVTDANGCTATQTYNITQPAYLSTTGTQSNVSCNGNGDATATVNVTGGTTPYTYSWAPTGGTGTTASSLTPGVYTVTVTDANLCVATRTFNITQPAVLATTGTQVDILCNGATTGSATVAATGGTTPYTYNWLPTGGTAATASGLAAGTYTVTVTDANLCATTQSYTITEPTALTYTTAQADVSCNGGSNATATINVSGGTGAYSYNWLPTGGTAATASGLTAGNYTVTATDANNCTVTATFTITQPAVLAANAGINTPVCTGDTMFLTGSAVGGTLPYTAMWTGPNSYSAPFQNTTINNTQVTDAGNYTVTFTDANGCTAADVETVVVNETPAVTTQPQPATACVGASAGFSITATGTGINYQWRANGVNLTNTGVYAGAFSNSLSISDVTGLDGTMYDVIVYGVCNPDTSIAVMLTAPSFNQWTGAIDTAWSNAGNWQCGLVPTIFTDVIIPGSAPKMPLVDITGAVANSVTINTGASLGFTATTNQLEIDENIINLGSFNAANGAVKLSGAGTQSIPGGTYREIEITGGNMKTTQGNATVTTDLVLTNGYLALGNNDLALAQNITITGGDASSFIITNGTGKVTAQGLGSAGNAGLFTFPIGTTAGVYTPAAVQNLGTVDNFNARVINGIYGNYANETPLGSPMSANSVDRTWFITEGTDGGSLATVQLSWPLSVQLPGFNTSLCDVSHYNGNTNTWESGTFTPATGSVVLFSQMRAGQTTFSPFGLGTANAPLNANGVVLSGIYNIGAKTVDLNWEKSGAADVVTYKVERSLNGINYKEIGAKEAGQDIYTLTDLEAGKLGVEQLYYRLQVLSDDNSYVYTNTIKVDIAGSVVTSGLTLYPNPVTGSQVFISIADNSMASDMDIAVVDMLGKEVSRQHYGAGTYNPNAIVLNIGDIADGLYTVRVKQSGVMMQTVKFTKK